MDSSVFSTKPAPHSSLGRTVTPGMTILFENSHPDIVFTSFVASSTGTTDKRSFGINHHTSSCSYDISQFVEKDADLLDSAFVSLLRNSSEPFVSKLFSGPSLAAERHSKDDGIIVQAQVSSRPLRQPTPIYPSVDDEHPRLDPNKTYPITTHLNFSLSELFSFWITRDYGRSFVFGPMIQVHPIHLTSAA